jgi:hypothetical protein
VFTARYVLQKLCIFCGSENKQRLFHCTALCDCSYSRAGVCLPRGTFCPQSIFLCFHNRFSVFTARLVQPKQCICERLFHCTALSDWFFMTENKCVFCAVRSVHTVYFCVFITEAVCLLVFITEKKCVYCSFRSAHSVFKCFYNRGCVCLLRGTFCRIFVFSEDLRTNSDYFTVQHKVTFFYNRDGVCSLRGTFCRNYIFCGSENKQRLFQCTALSDCFL